MAKGDISNLHFALRPVLVSALVSVRDNATPVIDNKSISLHLSLSSTQHFKALDSSQLVWGSIIEHSIPLQMCTGALHTETLSFMIIKSPHNPVVLGSSWLTTYDPVISWKEADDFGETQLLMLVHSNHFPLF